MKQNLNGIPSPVTVSCRAGQLSTYFDPGEWFVIKEQLHPAFTTTIELHCALLEDGGLVVIDPLKMNQSNYEPLIERHLDSIQSMLQITDWMVSESQATSCTCDLRGPKMWNGCQCGFLKKDEQ
jgi:hypothetical protein